MRLPNCSRCRQDFVRRRAPRTPLDRLLAVAFIHPFRCQLCGSRFRALWWGGRPDEEGRADRREYVRIQARLPARFSGEGPEQEGVVTDVSIAGCSLETEHPIVEGDLVELHLRVGEGEPPIVVDAAVVRYAGPWRVGLEFLRMQEEAKERLRDLVHRLYRARAPGPAAALGAGKGQEAGATEKQATSTSDPPDLSP